MCVCEWKIILKIKNLFILKESWKKKKIKIKKKIKKFNF
jgi:hypothetical protein